MTGSVISFVNMRLMSFYELSTLALELADAVNGIGTEESYLVKAAGRIKSILSVQHDALSHAAAAPYSDQLIYAGKLCDKALVGLKAALRYGKTLPFADVIIAAEHISSVFDVHGLGLGTSPFSIESARISALLADLDKEHNSMLLDRAGIREALERLRAAAAAFDSVLDEQAAYCRAKGMDSAPSITSILSSNKILIRKELKLVFAIVESEIRNSAEDWPRLLAFTINEIISRVVPASKRRSA